MNHSFSKTICCSAADDESNGSSANLDHDFTSRADFEVKDEERSFNQNNSSLKETECIMDSKLARKLVMIMAILAGFVFVGFSHAQAGEFRRAEFQSSAFNGAACCDFNQTAFDDSQFGQWNKDKAAFRSFSFTNRDFFKAATQAFDGKFTRNWDVRGDFVPSAEFKVAFASGFQNGVLAAHFVKTASIGREAFRQGDLFESSAFTRSTFEKDAFNGNFEIAEFANEFAPVPCCRALGFTGNAFPEFDAQFQTQV